MFLYNGIEIGLYLLWDGNIFCLFLIIIINVMYKKKDRFVFKFVMLKFFKCSVFICEGNVWVLKI